MIPSFIFAIIVYTVASLSTNSSSSRLLTIIHRNPRNSPIPQRESFTLKINDAQTLAASPPVPQIPLFFGLSPVNSPLTKPHNAFLSNVDDTQHVASPVPQIPLFFGRSPPTTLVDKHNIANFDHFIGRLKNVTSVKSGTSVATKADTQRTQVQISTPSDDDDDDEWPQEYHSVRGQSRSMTGATANTQIGSASFRRLLSSRNQERNSHNMN